jgi:hypothetical protein
MFKISMLRLSRAKNGIGANRQGDGVIEMVMVTWHKTQATIYCHFIVYYMEVWFIRKVPELEIQYPVDS